MVCDSHCRCRCGTKSRWTCRRDSCLPFCRERIKTVSFFRRRQTRCHLLGHFPRHTRCRLRRSRSVDFVADRMRSKVHFCRDCSEWERTDWRGSYSTRVCVEFCKRKQWTWARSWDWGFAIMEDFCTVGDSWCLLTAHSWCNKFRHNFHYFYSHTCTSHCCCQSTDIFAPISSPMRILWH